jgi:hypothetical protein
MENLMELDDLKGAWQALDRRLERQHALHLTLFREGKVARVKSGLRPLFWGQVLQVLFGACFILLAAAFWSGAPWPPHLVAAGVLVHLYGVASIAFAGVVLARMAGIDYTAPVLGIQRQLAALHAAYLRSGMVAGIPWWGMWLPVLMVALGLAEVDLVARAPAVAWLGIAVALVGIPATWWLHRWLRDPKRPALARAMEESLVPRSLRRARAQLEELARFEAE